MHPSCLQKYNAKSNGNALVWPWPTISMVNTTVKAWSSLLRKKFWLAFSSTGSSAARAMELMLMTAMMMKSKYFMLTIQWAVRRILRNGVDHWSLEIGTELKLNIDSVLQKPFPIIFKTSRENVQYIIHPKLRMFLVLILGVVDVLYNIEFLTAKLRLIRERFSHCL